MKSAFENELKIWMKNNLSPYCLTTCKDSCCDCSKEGFIPIDEGYEHLFKKFKIDRRTVPFSNKISKKGKPHLYKDEIGNWYYSGSFCPNYNPKDKKCMIHNQHPMCALFPLIKKEKEYQIVLACPLHKMEFNEEPLKSLFELCNKHGVKLCKQKIQPSTSKGYFNPSDFE